MKRIMKKALATLLAIVMISSSFVCFAAELNQDAVSKHYGQYKNYLLLGDSVASGFRDEVTDNDYDYNKLYNHTTYCRVPGSYADVLANAIVEDKSMTALAGPGFRTIEMRYMLEDDYMDVCADDPYLFHPFQLYAYEDETCACHGEKLLPNAEHFREAFKKSIAEADLITLGIGGNDWGAFISWLVADIFEKTNVADPYIAEIKEILDKSTLDIGTIETVIDLAHKAGALEELGRTVPDALNKALETFYDNWNYMIQDIYDLNPDVTLVVLSMSDNSIKGKHYDYNGVEGEVIETEAETDPTKALVTSTIIDFIMGVGNAPMIEGAKKFGYTYVDTDGTSYIESHPDAAGHVYIANKIIEALPDPEISKMFDDVTTGHKYYNAIEYVVANGIMKETAPKTFGADEALTKGQLAEALNTIFGSENATDNTKEVSAIEFAFTLVGGAGKKGFAGFFKTLALSLSVISDHGFKLTSDVTRGMAANYLKTFCEI